MAVLAVVLAAVLALVLAVAPCAWADDRDQEAALREIIENQRRAAAEIAQAAQAAAEAQALLDAQARVNPWTGQPPSWNPPKR